MTSPLVAVYGSSAGDGQDLDRARKLGAALARAGFGILNGGYGGTMGAVAEGARSQGGVAIGVTCAEFTFRAGPNPWCSEVVEAADLFERLAELVRMASAYVVLPGGNGTLAELALAWEHQRRGLLPPRPVVAWEKPWRRVMAALEATPYLEGGAQGIVWVRTVEEAVAAVRDGVPHPVG